MMGVVDLRQEGYRTRRWSVVVFDQERPTTFVGEDGAPVEAPLDGRLVFYRVRMSGSGSEADYAGRSDIVRSLLEDEQRTAYYARRVISRAPYTRSTGTEDDPLDEIARLEAGRHDAGNPDLLAWPRRDERRFYIRMRRRGRARPARATSAPTEPVTCSLTVRIVHDDVREDIPITEPVRR